MRRLVFYVRLYSISILALVAVGVVLLFCPARADAGSGAPWPENQPEQLKVAPRADAPDALDEVNVVRVRAGLRPFIRDEGLTKAATGAAMFRAERLIEGHSSNDFAFVPAGSSADAAGCGAMDASWGFRACCTHENWTYAGAASVRGRDGRVYHHLFVRGATVSVDSRASCANSSVRVGVQSGTDVRVAVRFSSPRHHLFGRQRGCR